MVSLCTPVPTIDLSITLPKTRKDGSSLAASDIASVTILRNSAEWKTLESPLATPLVASDMYPATELDTYSFYVTDTAGVRSDVSPIVKVAVSAEPPKAPPSSGTITAVVKGSAPAPKPVVDPFNTTGAPVPDSNTMVTPGVLPPVK